MGRCCYCCGAKEQLNSGVQNCWPFCTSSTHLTFDLRMCIRTAHFPGCNFSCDNKNTFSHLSCLNSTLYLGNPRVRSWFRKLPHLRTKRSHGFPTTLVPHNGPHTHTLPFVFLHSVQNHLTFFPFYEIYRCKASLIKQRMNQQMLLTTKCYWINAIHFKVRDYATS